MNTEGKVKHYVKRIQNYQCEHRPPDVTKSLVFTTNFRSAARQKSDDVDIKLGRRNERAGEDEENLIFVRGIPVKVVGHKQNVRSSGDQSMTRFHHLKAQKAERTHQFYCGHKRKSLKLYNSVQIKKNRHIQKLTTVFSVLIETDKHAANLQMFFSKLQKRQEAKNTTQIIQI